MSFASPVMLCQFSSIHSARSLKSLGVHVSGRENAASILLSPTQRQFPLMNLYSNGLTVPLEPPPPPGLTIPPVEPLGGTTLEVGGTIVPVPLEGVAPTVGTLEPPGATMLETSPDAGSTGVKLEGAAMLEADSSVMLGGSTELGGSRLI